MQSSSDHFLCLVRLGIGHSASAFPKTISWEIIQALAVKQGLSAIVLDGIDALRKRGEGDSIPEKKILTPWICEVLQGYECRYESYQKAISELAGFYNRNSYKMMVIKGYACSLNWPRPEHRPCGDIDIWQFGKQEEADVTLTREMGVKIDHSHHKHSVFSWCGFVVENHFDFINIYHHKSNRKLEAILKKLGEDDSIFTIVNGEKVYLPSSNLHALLLLRHSMSHFVASDITLRHLLDWAFFVERHTKEIDWKWLNCIVDKYGMRPAFNIFNEICIEDLGFDATVFGPVKNNPILKDRVLNEIISPEFSEKAPKSIVRRAVFKYRRWRANSWKHELCFHESMWSAFWSGVLNHMLKPKSI